MSKQLRNIFLLIVIPIASITFMVMTKDNYYIASTIMIVSMLIALFMDFDGKKPKARELSIISILIVLAIGLRVLFVWIPQFKPTLRIVIIAGIALGRVKGFIVGALSMLISNILFGQGLWTPWQMFAFGIVGYISGIFANRLRNKKVLTIYGFLSVILIAGPILDTSSVFTILSEYTKEGIIGIYGSGFVMNLIHATSVSLALYLIGEDLLKKLDRAKIKYGDFNE